MSGLKIALLSGCLALVAGSTITVQKTALSLTEESEEQYGQARAQVYDVTSVTNMRIQKVRGKRFLPDTCTFSTFNKLCRFTCKEIGKFNVCFTAKLNYLSILPETADVEIEGTVGGLKMFAERLGRSSDPNPPPKCSTSSVFYACMVLKDVNPSKLSACIELLNKTSSTTYQIGCFRTNIFGTTTVKDISGSKSTLRSTRKESENTNTSSAAMTEQTSQGSTSGSSYITMETSIKPNGDDVNGSERIGTFPLFLSISVVVLKIWNMLFG